MGKIILLLALFNSIYFIGQESLSASVTTRQANLCLGDMFNFGDKSIKFEKVISDSRCPKEVTCVWAGEVKVLIAFYENGKLKGEKIVSVAGGDISEIFGVEGLTIESLNIRPYPSIKHKISKDEYSLEIKISEGKS